MEGNVKLRNKVLIAIGLAWSAFLILSYSGSRYILLQSFLHLEEEHAAQDLTRITQASKQIEFSLDSFTSDWSNWNDLYAFMQGKNPEFVPNNFNLGAFINSTINLLTYWDTKGNLIVGTAVDTQNKRFIPYPRGLEKYFRASSILLQHRKIDNNLRGYISLPNGIMMIVSSAISDGSKSKPILGVMVTGRYLSTEMLQKMSDAIGLPLQLLTIADIEKNVAYHNLFLKMAYGNKSIFSRPIDEYTLEGFTLIKDINQNPIGMFRMTAPRKIYLTGVKFINYYLISFILLGALVSILIIGLLRKLIIGRLEQLAENLSDISTRKELATRVDASGNDELSSVAREINLMMDAIQSSHIQLEQRVEERTQDLKQEITERKAIEQDLLQHKEHLLRLAHYDSLTQLPNRFYFNQTLNKAIVNAQRHNKSLAVLFLDLDRFKHINDAFGHAIGDLVLKEVAVRFSSVLRSDDILARLGGDEFIILLHDVDQAKSASRVAKKLQEICSTPVIIEQHEFHITTSIGICIFPDDGISLEDLQRNADMAMYQAKKIGGNIYHYYTRKLNDEAHEHIKLESGLRKAIANNELSLHYQPKYNLKDNSIAGVEALLRWESPAHGMISPSKFIPLAEETGLISSIGEWVLREACRAHKSWQNQGHQPLLVAVNLSAKQFRHQDIAESIIKILAEESLDPRYLEIEITETAIIDDIDNTIRKLSTLKNVGVSLSIDDFGTGYTSINYLKQYPIDILKIDKTFIKGIPENTSDAAITSALISLAHSLGLKVVAEGVETVEQLRYLTDHDCNMAQGFYLSKPLAENKLLALLAMQNKEIEMVSV